MTLQHLKDLRAKLKPCDPTRGEDGKIHCDRCDFKDSTLPEQILDSYIALLERIKKMGLNMGLNEEELHAYDELYGEGSGFIWNRAISAVKDYLKGV